MFVPRHFALCVYVKWRGIFLASLKMKSSGILLSQPLCCFCECKKRQQESMAIFRNSEKGTSISCLFAWASRDWTRSLQILEFRAKEAKGYIFIYFFNYLGTTCECFCIEMSSTKRTTKKTPPITQKRISTETLARESLAKLSKVKKITRLFAKWLSDQLSYSFIQIWA